MSDQIVAGIIGAAIGGVLVAIVVALAKRGWAVHKRASEAVTIDACRDCKDEIGEWLATALKEICTILKIDCDEPGRLLDE